MKIHYLDWAEKIRKKYSQIGEYGFAGATLTFLQGEKHSEPQNRGEERRLMLFFQNLIFCWENSIGVKLSIGNERVLEKSVRLALETAIQKLTSEEKTHFSREVKIARELLEGKEKTEIQMQKSLVFRRWQEGYSWEEISGHGEIREYAERLEETRNRRQELARIRNREIASIQSRADARIQSKEMEFAQIQNMEEVQNTEEAWIQNQHMRQHQAKGSLLEKMQDQSNLVHREANETLGEREVRLNKTESQRETVRLEKREQESRLETIRLEKREQESQRETIRLEKREQESRLETTRLEKRERESRMEIPSEKVQPEPRDTQPELQKMQTELNRQQEKLTETQIQLEKEAQILKHPENSLVHLEPVQKPEHPESSLVYLEPEQKPEHPESSLVHLEPMQKPEHPESSLVHLEPAQKPDHPESSLLHRESKKAPDESGVQDRAKIQALEQEQEKKLSVRAEADRLEIEKERVRTERQNQLETESRLERAIERQNRSEAESRLERAAERQNRSEAESRLESATERQNQDGEDISVDSKPFGEELTAEPAGMEEFEHPESSLVYLESKETSDGTGIQPRAEKRLELESSSEKAQPEPRDTQTELQKMQTELNRQQEKLTETQIQLEKEAQILKHPENSLVHLEPVQKPEHPESSLVYLEPEQKPEHPESSLVHLEPMQMPERPESSLVHLEPMQKPEHPESSLVHLEPEQKPERPESSLVHLEPVQKPEHPESSLLHRKSNKAPDESRQDKAKILLNNLSESASQRKKQPENRLVPGAVERIEKNVKTMEKVLERFRVVTETRKSVFSEPHIVEKHSNVRLEKLVSETLQQKQEKIRTAALQQNHRVRTIKRIIPRLEVLPGNREMRLEILETAGKTSGYEAGQEFTSLPELSTTAKIQYTVPENRKTDRTNVGSEVSAISATLAQTREETRILRKNTGYTRTALIEQEKKIDGIRKELNTQMKQVNEEVRRLMDTQRRDMSVQNLAGKVMKELQRQFRTEKIRRGY